MSIIYITGSGAITIFIYKGLTRNPEIRNTPVLVLSNIQKLERVRDIEFRNNVSKLLLLNAENARATAFIKGKSTSFFPHLD